ncbi:uncharacterized protein LOC119185884 isoform X3 [Rhipicephalus microplus]|uniref:uncharacterized protein LOC119185884 isoform X3 n=1 Tax=Rhipicephalus microplus TaxID=6941 RepID=UPI003F6A969E
MGNLCYTRPYKRTHVFGQVQCLDCLTQPNFFLGQKSAHSLLSGFAPYDGFAANCRCFLDTAESHLRFACLWNRRQLHGICHQLDLVSWTGYRQRMRDIGQFNAYKRTASNRILRWARRKLEKRTINHASRILVPDGFAANCRCFLDTAESHLRFACLWNRRQLHGICHQLDLVSWTGYRQRMRDIGQFNAYKRTASNRILRWARRKLEKRTINHASRILVPEGPQVTLKVHPLHRCLSLLCGLAVDRDHGAPTPCCRCLRSATRASSRTSSCLMWCGGSEGQPPTSLL